MLIFDALCKLRSFEFDFFFKHTQSDRKREKSKKQKKTKKQLRIQPVNVREETNVDLGFPGEKLKS